MRLVEYRPKPSFRQVARIVFWIALLVWLALRGLELFAGLAVLGTVTMELLQFLVLAAALVSVTRRRALLYPILGVLLAANCVFFFIHNDGAEYYFPSPNRENTLVIREKSALISSGWAELYRLEYGIFKRRLPARVGTDDNYQPFAHGQYRLEWLDERTAAIDYYNGHGYQRLEVTVTGGTE